jgi:small conductance mechanosensitive channel
MDISAIQTELAGAYDAVAAMVIAYGLSVVGAVLLLVIGWIVSGLLKSGTDHALQRIKAVDDTLRHFISSLVKYAVLVVVGVMVLEKFGVQTASLIAVIGAAGLAIGLAMQGTLQNVAAGVMLLAFRPFKVGDYIDAGGLAGTVKSLSLFVTELATPDNVKIVAPNAELWNKAIFNYSANPTRRLDIGIGISYGDDMDRGLAALKAMAEAEPRIHKDPAPQVMVMALGASSVDLNLRVWVAATDYWAVKFDLTKAAKDRIEAAGLSIPFPQLDVHHVPKAAE